MHVIILFLLLHDTVCVAVDIKLATFSSPAPHLAASPVLSTCRLQLHHTCPFTFSFFFLLLLLSFFKFYSSLGVTLLLFSVLVLSLFFLYIFIFFYPFFFFYMYSSFSLRSSSPTLPCFLVSLSPLFLSIHLSIFFICLCVYFFMSFFLFRYFFHTVFLSPFIVQFVFIILIFYLSVLTVLARASLSPHLSLRSTSPASALSSPFRPCISHFLLRQQISSFHPPSSPPLISTPLPPPPLYHHQHYHHCTTLATLPLPLTSYHKHYAILT